MSRHPLTAHDRFRAYSRSALEPDYFVTRFCRIQSPTERQWIRFRLWPRQRETLRAFHRHSAVIVLKARQLGLTWLAAAYALWTILFRPGASVLLFSRRDAEAIALLDRLREMNARLPGWLRAEPMTDNKHELAFDNLDARVRAFPTTRHSARSYTATLAIVDEADFIPWLRELMAAVRPTVDAGGRLILLSTADKDHPDSEFKRLWHLAAAGSANFEPVFLPWSAHPERDADWYARLAADYPVDDLHQEYPASPAEALAPRKSSKRFSFQWLQKCHEPVGYAETGHQLALGAQYTPAALEPWTVYELPRPGRRYVISADPAEGNPASDPSAAMIWDAEAWAEVAHLHGQFEPDVLAAHLVSAAHAYNDAVICPERNNHGHAVILAIQMGPDAWGDSGADGTDLLYESPHDGKPGWLSNVKYKVLAADNAAQVFREGACTIRTEAVVQELAMLDASSLRAPDAFHDDRAMACLIGLAALRWPSQRHTATGDSIVIPPIDPIADIDRHGGF